MVCWRWFTRRDHVDDPIGPATIYSAGRSGYARGSASADGGQRVPDPAWNAPTIRYGKVPTLVDGEQRTLGQETGYRRLGTAR